LVGVGFGGCGFWWVWVLVGVGFGGCGFWWVWVRVSLKHPRVTPDNP